MMKPIAVWLSRVVLGTGCALAQGPVDSPPPVPQPDRVPPATYPATRPAAIDQVLRELEAVGKNLRSFIANVTLTETDALTADQFGRTGSVVYEQRGKTDARLRVNFERKVVSGRSQEHRVDYLLDDGWLIERDYRGKTEVRRQVLRPGQKLDLLKLGEGPFPLPIGQEVDEVHRLFEVTMPPPGEDAPANTDHLRLTPRPNSQFASKFQSIDVWVDRGSHMPVRIETLDASGDVLRTTDLTNVQVNPPIVDARFELPPIDDTWNRHEEPFSD